MDLPERLGAKMESRLGYTRLVFKSYTREQVGGRRQPNPPNPNSNPTSNPNNPCTQP